MMIGSAEPQLRTARLRLRVRVSPVGEAYSVSIPDFTAEIWLALCTPRYINKWNQLEKLFFINK